MRKSLIVWAILFCAITGGSAQDALSPSWIFLKSSDSGGKAFGWGLALTETGKVLWTPSLKLANWPKVQVPIHLLDSETGMETAPSNPIQGNAEFQAYSTAVGGGFGWIAGRACPGLINSCDQWLAKTSEEGLPVWSKTYDVAGNYDEIDGIAIRPGDGIYLGGWGGEAGAGIYDTDFSLRKVDFDGNSLWEKQIGLPTTAEHQDGHFVVDDEFIFAAGLWGGDGIANLHEGRAFLAKFSKVDGTLLDSVHFGAANLWLNWENAWGMASDGLALYLTGVSTPIAGNNQVFVARFSKELDLQWLIHWGGAGTETARAIAVSGGRVFVGGTSNSPNLATAGAYDAALLVLHAETGAFESAKIWGNNRDNEFRDLVVNDEAVFLSGTSGTNLFNSSNPSNMEAFLMRVEIADLITSGREESAENSAFQGLLYPNPASKSCTWRFEAARSGSCLLEMTDLHGKMVQQYRVSVLAGENMLGLYVQDLPKGMFLVSLYMDGEKFAATRMTIF